jgi:hypothetical protein
LAPSKILLQETEELIEAFPLQINRLLDPPLLSSIKAGLTLLDKSPELIYTEFEGIDLLIPPTHIGLVILSRLLTVSYYKAIFVNAVS